MTAAGNLSIAHKPARGGDASTLHLLHRRRGQQVGVFSAQDQGRARNLVPDLPQRQIKKHRHPEPLADGGVVTEPKPAIGIRNSAVRREVPPLRVAQIAEGRQDVAKVPFNRNEAGETQLVPFGQIVADPLKRTRLHPGPDIVLYQTTDRCRWQRRQLHADVAAQ